MLIAERDFKTAALGEPYKPDRVSEGVSFKVRFVRQSIEARIALL